MHRIAMVVLGTLFLILVIVIGAGAYVQSNAATPETTTISEESSTEVTGSTGWDEASHGDSADPNYEVVFPDNKVNQLVITIDPENWATMQADMTDLYGEAGTGENRDGGFGGPRDGQQPPAFEEGDMPQGGPPGGFGGMGGLESDVNPVWVTATIEFEGQTWSNVGIRYKGNSSLRSSWSNGSLNLPFKLDFDQFEDTYPDIKNQRFYGFKQLSLNNNFGDNTYIRETIAYDLLDEAGLVAAETAIYEIVLDYGEGPVNLGLYTVVELIDDTVVKRYFGGDTGNIYKPSGTAATLAEGTSAQIEGSFDKENNDADPDWSDIEALYTVLHAESRTTDPEAWRNELESLFNVDGFLQWLALSAMLEHWDTYGGMAHNYYLYHDPESGLIEWISWDHNLVLGASAGGGGGFGENPRGEPPDGFPENIPNPEEGMPQPPAGMQGGRGGGGGMGRNTSLGKEEVTDQWPLIRYLLDDPTYYATYVGYLEAMNGTVFNADELAEHYQTLATMIAPYVESEEALQSAIQALIQRTYERSEAVTEFLENQ